MKNVKPSFNYKACMACGICVVACPVSCLELSKIDVDKYKKAYPALSDVSTCISCSICSKQCPYDAIEMISK